MTKETVTIASNAVHARLHEPSRQIKLEVQSILSYMVDGAEHSKAFKSGGWDGRSSFLDFRTGSFPAGFVQFVSAHLRRNGHEIRLVRKPLPLPLGPENPKVDNFPDDPRYDYQPEVVRRLIKHGQIIAQVATGGGKSRIARLAFARINRTTLFLTTRGILMHQMRDAFVSDMKVEVSVLGDGQFGVVEEDEDGNKKRSIKKMSVGMVQTFLSRLRETTVEKEFEGLYDSLMKAHKKADTALRKIHAKLDSRAMMAKIVELHKAQERELKAKDKPMQIEAKQRCDAQMAIRARTIRLLEKFEFVILEEAHESSGNSYYDILKHCKNAHYRLALTATPFMKSDEEANMRLMASSGPIGIKVTEKTLIERGILAKPFFKVVRLKDKPAKLMRGTGWPAAYRLGITDCVERNGVIVNEAVRAANHGLSVMVLIQHKAHGDTLLDMLTAKGLSAEYIQGSDNQAERKSALGKLSKGEIDVLIGTTILDVGVDVPAVGMIILAGGGKAEVALRQRIGRGLRAKKRGPNIALIVDFDDPFNGHLKDHATQRKQIIKDTEGFGENLLPGDFDYAALGLARKAA
jgi:superfamily II DNA or RNA helicase